MKTSMSGRSRKFIVSMSYSIVAVLLISPSSDFANVPNVVEVTGGSVNFLVTIQVQVAQTSSLMRLRYIGESHVQKSITDEILS